MILRSYITLTFSTVIVLCLCIKQYNTTEILPQLVSEFPHLKTRDYPNQNLNQNFMNILKEKWEGNRKEKEEVTGKRKWEQTWKEKMQKNKEIKREKRKVKWWDEKKEEEKEEKMEYSKPLNSSNFEKKIEDEWNELENEEIEAWTNIINTCWKTLTHKLKHDAYRNSKIGRWNNMFKAFSKMREIKNKLDKRRLQEFKEHIQNISSRGADDESWNNLNEMWEIIKYLKVQNDMNWESNLMKSWKQWFQREIPEIKNKIL
ncbi:ring-exported protein, unknown function [Plasmodium malariae]|uniref:Tryptophan-rich antigen n=1 Tax=Plasmodium malariae TaxID=5858 RepID=A0A1A8WUE5_PLAMA|nr:ring-exported protein, unknown function [Plasmodium malariae]